MDKSEEISNKLREYCNLYKIQITDENFNMVCREALTNEEYELCFLTDEVSVKIDEHAKAGDVFFDTEEYGKAIEVYKKGIEFIPEPKELWETKLWFTVAIADSFWMLDWNKEALVYLNESLNVVGGKKNPFVRLRRGQVLYELGRIDEAKHELRKGYDLNGKELFEDEDPKFWNLIKEE